MESAPSICESNSPTSKQKSQSNVLLKDACNVDPTSTHHDMLKCRGTIALGLHIAHARTLADHQPTVMLDMAIICADASTKQLEWGIKLSHMHLTSFQAVISITVTKISYSY